MKPLIALITILLSLCLITEAQIILPVEPTPRIYALQTPEMPLVALNSKENAGIRAIIGESSDQGYKGMLAVACGIRNRGTLKGVYGLNSPHIDKEPQWVWDMAKRAWKESEYNRVHSGTHWHNVKREGENYWTIKMIKVYEYKDHVFYKERKNE